MKCSPASAGLHLSNIAMKSKRLALASIVVCSTIAAHYGVAQTIDPRRTELLKDKSGTDESKQTYSVRFTLTCANGSCASVWYKVCYPSDVSAIGTTDAQGRTIGYETDAPQLLKLLLGHHNPGDCGDKSPLGIQVAREVQPIPH